MSHIKIGLKGHSSSATDFTQVGEEEDDEEDEEEDRAEGDDQDDPGHNASFRQIASLISGSTVMTTLAAEYTIPGQPDQMSKITFRSASRLSAPDAVRSIPLAR